EAGEELGEGEGEGGSVRTAYTSSQATGATTSRSTGSAAAAGPQPTPERVSSAEIADVADANGVPANLAEAIAWQESGWNNDVVSGVGAVGVMQIVPNTWSWIDRYLTPSNPLGTASASENVRAGVLLLRQLLQLTGGNQPLAIAGYYQGLGTVKRFGMYPSTRHYVDNVLALEQRF
ncbi:MAG: lytic transglycosylase domain-containing protein, partial [Acidobacteriota bacterium]|nr:lytic transglycosylase domain-containing protein [Acidobacteriota bacterium]